LSASKLSPANWSADEPFGTPHPAAGARGSGVESAVSEEYFAPGPGDTKRSRLGIRSLERLDDGPPWATVGELFEEDP
jgi:hypothetical protein